MTCAIVYMTVPPTSATGERLIGYSSTRTRRSSRGLQTFPPRSTGQHEQTMTVGASVVILSAMVRDLGVLLDQELGMTQHIARVTSSCFYQLQIRRSIGQELVFQLGRLVET